MLSTVVFILPKTARIPIMINDCNCAEDKIAVSVYVIHQGEVGVLEVVTYAEKY